ncbi:DUF1894 domain-containing protein [Methanohalobium sp.]|uniref:DUF1894 domain-containing protein n=1 Tax=Methanohalobium sp. TaxID=2837493 RepID=UPI0025F0CE59|nr:DUF1894 domain-containing protein [Methanohalobium sp.]
MTCISDLPYEIVLSGVTPSESEKYIKQNSDETFYVPGGYKLLGVVLRGGHEIPVGVKDSDLLFQYVKPCSGLFVLRIRNEPDEVKRLRSDKTVKTKK